MQRQVSGLEHLIYVTKILPVIMPPGFTSRTLLDTPAVVPQAGLAETPHAAFTFQPVMETSLQSQTQNPPPLNPRAQRTQARNQKTLERLRSGWLARVMGASRRPSAVSTSCRVGSQKLLVMSCLRTLGCMVKLAIPGSSCTFGSLC